MLECRDCGSKKITTVKRINNGCGDSHTREENNRFNIRKAEFRTRCEVCSRHSYWAFDKETADSSFLYVAQQSGSYVKPDFSLFPTIRKER